MSQSPSNFAFLLSEWPLVHEAAARAEELAHTDPRSACFHARRALELLVEWAFTFDRSLRRPYQDQISALVHEPASKQTAGQAVFTKALLIIKYGNGAVHSRPVQPVDALNSVRELFHVCFWFARTYARGAAPAARVQPGRAPQNNTDTQANTRTAAQVAGGAQGSRRAALG